MNIEKQKLIEINKVEVDSLFSTIWYGENLTLGSGIKQWQEGSVCILNQPSYKLDIPINWLDDPYNHRSWRWILNSFQWMDQLLARFKLNYDQGAIEECAKFFLDWADFYILSDREGEFLWKDDAVSFRTFRLSIIASYIFSSNNYTENEKDLTNNILQKHYMELSNPKKFKSNNHGIFQMRALMSLLTLHPYIGDFSETKKYVIKRLNWLWVKQYGKQSLHLENSTGYHQYIVKEFDEILSSPEFEGFKFSFNGFKVKEVKENAKYLFHPNGIGTLFGDSNFVKQEHSVVNGDHIFNEAGYAILAGNEESEENSYLAIRTGFPSNAHRHSDDFSFEWSEKGRVILQDSGRFSYDYKSDERSFVTSSLAHNTVSIDKKNFPWWGDFSKDDFYEGAVLKYQSSNKGASLLTLNNFFKKLNVNFYRQIKYMKGTSLFIDDVLSSSDEHEYIQWFHFSEYFTPTDVTFESEIAFKCDKFTVKIENISGADFVFFTGQKKPFYQGWISYKEKHLIPRWTIGFKTIARSATIKTKLLIC